MKIGMFGMEGFSSGKEDIVDNRVDALQQMFSSPKKVYIQAEVLADEAEKLVEADVIVCPVSGKLDLVVNDMEFVETRLQRSQNDQEKALLARFKDQLDKEQLLCELALSSEEKKLIEGFSLLSLKPALFVTPEQAQDTRKLFFDAYYRAGYISFFTAGEKDAHAWPIKSGATAWDAAGAIHTAIQKGFIRAEVVNYTQLAEDGSLSKAKSANHVRLEMKEYVVQDGDYLVIRTNK